MKGIPAIIMFSLASYIYSLSWKWNNFSRLLIILCQVMEKLFANKFCEICEKLCEVCFRIKKLSQFRQVSTVYILQQIINFYKNFILAKLIYSEVIFKEADVCLPDNVNDNSTSSKPYQRNNGHKNLKLPLLKSLP